MSLGIQKQLTFSFCNLLAKKRFEEAKTLYAHRKYSGSYYLVGYSVELSIKAYYCRKMKKNAFPPNPQIISKLYTHDLETLLKISELESLYQEDIKTDLSLYAAWQVVKTWDEKSRYITLNSREAKTLISSVEEIVKWIRTKY